MACKLKQCYCLVSGVRETDGAIVRTRGGKSEGGKEGEKERE